MVLKTKRYSFALLFVLALVGIQPVLADTAAVVKANQETLIAVNETLRKIKRELRELRNSVEELQFDSEVGARRQKDLFQDLDRRMIMLELSNQAIQEFGNQTKLQRSSNPVGIQQQSNKSAIKNLDNRADVQGQNSQTVIQNVNNQIDIQRLSDQIAVQNHDGQTNNADGINNIIQQANNDISNTRQLTNILTFGNQLSRVEDAVVADVATGTLENIPADNVSGVTLVDQQAYDLAFELLKQSRYEESIKQFKQIVDTWPNSALADDAYYWLSEAYYVNREYEKALSGFRIVISNYADSDRVPDALLKVGYIQYDVGAYNEAAETFRDILERFPGHQITISAQIRLLRIEQAIQ